MRDVALGLAAARRRRPARAPRARRRTGTRRTTSRRWPCGRGARSATTPPPGGAGARRARRSCARARSRRWSRPATRSPPPTATRPSIACWARPISSAATGREALALPEKRGRRGGHDRRGAGVAHRPDSTTCAGDSTRRWPPSAAAATMPSRRAMRAAAAPRTPAPTGCAARPRRAEPGRPRHEVAVASRADARSRRPTPCWPCSPPSRATTPATTPTTCAPSTTPSGPTTSCRSSASASTTGRAISQGAHEAAIVELDLAIRSPTWLRRFPRLALTNRRKSRLRLGRLEEAIADLDVRASSISVSAPTTSLPADDPRRRLPRARRRRAGARGLRGGRAAGDAMGDLQALVPGASRPRARARRRRPEQAERARRRAAATGPAWAGRRAVAVGHAPSPPAPRGSRAAAAPAGAAARGGATGAHGRGARARGPAAPSARRAPRRSSRRSIWHELGNPLGEARASSRWPGGPGGAPRRRPQRGRRAPPRPARAAVADRGSCAPSRRAWPFETLGASAFAAATSPSRGRPGDRARHAIC